MHGPMNVKFKGFFLTLQIIQFDSITNCRSMLCSEIAHSDNHTEHGNKVRGQNADSEC